MPVKPRTPSWASARRAALRTERYAARVPDPRYPTTDPDKVVLWNPLIDRRGETTEHATRRGYQEFGCHCLDRGLVMVNPDDPDSPRVVSGCGPVGRQDAAPKRRERYNATAATQPLRPIRPATQRDDRPTEPLGSALAQLDQDTIPGLPPVTHTDGDQ